MFMIEDLQRKEKELKMLSTQLEIAVGQAEQMEQKHFEWKAITYTRFKDLLNAKKRKIMKLMKVQDKKTEPSSSPPISKAMDQKRPALVIPKRRKKIKSETDEECYKEDEADLLLSLE